MDIIISFLELTMPSFIFMYVFFSYGFNPVLKWRFLLPYKLICISALLLYPFFVFLLVIIEESFFLPKSSSSLDALVPALSWLLKGFPLDLSFVSYNTFFLLTGTFPVVSKHALASPVLVKTLPWLHIHLQLVLHFSACQHSTMLWESCLYWMSPLPYLMLTSFWLPSRKPSLCWNSFSRDHRWSTHCWILSLFPILLNIL